ncbi:MAG: hypothetical protein V1929_05000 [bacterium]
MKRMVGCALILLLLAAYAPAWSSCLTSGYALNQSYTTLCAEVDNINIPIVFTNVTSYRVTASHPDYYPVSINEGGADFTNCESITDDLLWLIGNKDDSTAEFRPSGFSDPDDHYAQDNPPEGIDETATNFPNEINATSMRNQYIHFSANESGDANTELNIGSTLTLEMNAITGTLQILCETWNGTGWTSQGTQTLIEPGAITGTWNIADFTWLPGTDSNTIHFHVISETGGVTTAGARGFYDYVELRKRRQLFETVESLYDDGTTVVHAINIDFWWRAPRHMTINAIGGGINTNAHYLRIARLTPTNASWNQFFILYEDGNARILPLPPNGMYLGHFGASVILGPSADSVRPFCGIDSLTVDPHDLSVDIVYENGGTSHVELWSDRNQTVVDVTGITYNTATQSFARLRSMWVHDGKSDIDRIENEDGVFPILDPWTALGGAWWRFLHKVPSYHNTYAPEYEIDVTEPSQAFATRQAESPDAGSNYTVVARSNAVAGSVLAMSAAGGEASYNLSLTELRIDVRMYLRYADVEGGDNGNVNGNTIAAYVDGQWKDETWSANTGGSNSFETLPTLRLGDLTPGTHTLRIVTGPLTQGVDLDQFELVAGATRAWTTNVFLSRECESTDSASGITVTNSPHASGGQSAVMSSNGATGTYSITLPVAYTDVFAEVRYAEDWAPNRTEIRVDGTLAGKFPSLKTQPLSLQNEGFEIGAAHGAAATGWWRYADASQEDWASQTGTNGMAFFPWGTYQFGGFGQDVPVTNAQGNVYTFSISAFFDSNFTSSTHETFMKMEFWAPDEPTNRYAVTNTIYDALATNRNAWVRCLMTQTNADPAISIVKALVGFGDAVPIGGNQAAKWDNARLTQSSGVPFDFFTNAPPMYIGNLATGVHTIVLSSSAETEGLNLDSFNLCTLSRANRAPGLGVPAPVAVPVGSSTSFLVTVSEFDPDCVDLSNPGAPTGSTFFANTFSWTPGAGDAGTTSTVAFTANDQQGDTNSIVTSNVLVVVPFDWDGDGMGDGWEWSSFLTLTNQPDADPDDDGIPNADEFIAGTLPTSDASYFHVMNQDLSAARQITIPTQPARHYNIFFADGAFSNGMTWARFANTNNGVGSWTETNSTAATFTFVDDFGPSTTGGESSSGVRHYRVGVELP